MEQVISTLVWAALIQGLLLSLLYIFSSKHRSLANRLLGLFLLVIVYEGIYTFEPYNGILGYQFYYFALPEVKLLYPLLFFHYVLEKLGRSARYRKFLRYNYVLAFAIMGVTLINVLLFLITGKKIEDYLGKELVENLFLTQQYYAFLLIVTVFILATRELIRYRKVVQEEYSDYQMLNINWLWRLILVLLPIIILWGINLLWIALGGRNDFSFELATCAFVVVFLYFVSFQAFKHKNLFEGVEERQEGASDKVTEAASPKNDVTDPEQDGQRELIQRIRQHMEAEKPYLDASLSIYQLARQVNLPVRDLSQLINHTLNQHFFDFVNEYRIKKAMEILRDPQQERLTVLEVLYEVGFNSKSSFNTVFKKYTGKTPTQYRKNVDQIVKVN